MQAHQNRGELALEDPEINLEGMTDSKVARYMGEMEERRRQQVVC